MDENKDILFNYLISINNKKSEDLNSTNNQKDIKNNDTENIDNIKSNGQISFDLNNNSNNFEKNNGIELNNPINNEINNESKATLTKELSNKINKKSFSIKNSFEPINNNIKEKDNEYNKGFKNRMDIMQAVLDDELKISQDENTFIRRKAKSKTAFKLNTHKEKEKKKKEEKEKKEDIEKKEVDGDGMKNYIFDKEKEINLENYYIKPNGNEEVKQNNKEELDIKNSYKILEEKNKNLEDNIKIQEKSKNLEETPKPKEEKRKILIIPKNLNKISEEINFQIFNEKPSNQKKSSYIDIDFHYKDNNKKKNRNNSEKMKNHIVLEFKPILIENNISKKSNKSKINFNKSHINIKDFNNNNNFVNRYSAFPISKHFFIQSNRKNMVIKINSDNIKEKKEIIPQTLDSLMNKIKINNLKRSQNSNNNRINKKIKDIKDSLKKMSDIKQHKKINTNQNSLNNIYLDYIEDSFLPKM